MSDVSRAEVIRILKVHGIPLKGELIKDLTIALDGAFTEGQDSVTAMYELSGAALKGRAS